MLLGSTTRQRTVHVLGGGGISQLRDPPFLIRGGEIKVAVASERSHGGREPGPYLHILRLRVAGGRFVGHGARALAREHTRKLRIDGALQSPPKRRNPSGPNLLAHAVFSRVGAHPRREVAGRDGGLSAQTVSSVRYGTGMMHMPNMPHSTVFLGRGRVGGQAHAPISPTRHTPITERLTAKYPTCWSAVTARAARVIPAHRSEIVDGIIAIYDRSAAEDTRSVTNGIGRVVREVAAELGGLGAYPMIYCDSAGVPDGIVHANGRFAQFCSTGERVLEPAPKAGRRSIAFTAGQNGQASHRPAEPVPQENPQEPA